MQISELKWSQVEHVTSKRLDFVTDANNVRFAQGACAH